MKIPTRVPEKGFYYHYKHDDQAYEVIGVGWHSENNEYTVIYRPLYKNDFLIGAEYITRPVEMFTEIIMKDEKSFPRFQKINDEKIIKKLEILKIEMYGE